ncbi:hypothetical protein GPECTOR_5g137 [Gonium pectorale]|uniref:Alpha 1,4-glycosyltransferase domain-containing protein n=1 Tax=Gonium pectorale TaxID=33097 RepID=A0A150GVW6_GONPE|nr:hypothetical protein GPECTOR_5g137 [Gonium pectorale]|eukprot:KXZ54027.1 hypothetical protein GPECTOR_5g137 [Gonium pectorale]
MRGDVNSPFRVGVGSARSSEPASPVPSAAALGAGASGPDPTRWVARSQYSSPLHPQPPRLQHATPRGHRLAAAAAAAATAANGGADGSRSGSGSSSLGGAGGSSGGGYGSGGGGGSPGQASPSGAAASPPRRGPSPPPGGGWRRRRRDVLLAGAAVLLLGASLVLVFGPSHPGRQLVRVNQAAAFRRAAEGLSQGAEAGGDAGGGNSGGGGAAAASAGAGGDARGSAGAGGSGAAAGDGPSTRATGGSGGGGGALLQARQALARHRGGGIPRIIHQVHVQVPSGLDRSIASWRGRNPGYTHVLWGASDVEELVETMFPAFAPAFRAFAHLPVLRADLARYLAVFAFGGVYADADTICLRPVDGWADGRPNVSAIVGIEADAGRIPNWRRYWGRQLQFCQWTFAAEPAHPLLAHVLFRISQLLEAKPAEQLTVHDVIHVTGPSVMSDAGRHWEEFEGLTYGSVAGDVLVLPITAFSPGVGHMGAGPVNHPEARVQHLFGGSWRKQGVPPGTEGAVGGGRRRGRRRMGRQTAAAAAARALRERQQQLAQGQHPSAP